MRTFNATGILKYSNSGWLIIETSNSIVNYYKWWVEKLKWIKASTPYYGAHITVIAGKYTPGITQHYNWGKYHGQKITFKYSNEITFEKQQDGIYFWLPIECEQASRIRQELDLSPLPKFPFHLTVAFAQK